MPYLVNISWSGHPVKAITSLIIGNIIINSRNLYFVLRYAYLNSSVSVSYITSFCKLIIIKGVELQMESLLYLVIKMQLIHFNEY